jgi:hypothetical protein
MDRDHYQRIEAVRTVTGDDMEHFLLAPNGELEDLILDYLGFPADGTQSREVGSLRETLGTGSITKCWKADCPQRMC